MRRKTADRLLDNLYDQLSLIMHIADDLHKPSGRLGPTGDFMKRLYEVQEVEEKFQEVVMLVDRISRIAKHRRGLLRPPRVKCDLQDDEGEEDEGDDCEDWDSDDDIDSEEDSTDESSTEDEEEDEQGDEETENAGRTSARTDEIPAASASVKPKKAYCLVDIIASLAGIMDELKAVMKHGWRCITDKQLTYKELQTELQFMAPRLRGMAAEVSRMMRRLMFR